MRSLGSIFKLVSFALLLVGCVSSPESEAQLNSLKASIEKNNSGLKLGRVVI
jgi:hypothetical protein